MLRIALTGGIGSGKTTVTEYFRDLNVIILDADEISHKLTKNNPLILGEIEEAFGRMVMNIDNSLNRHALRQLVFNDVESRKQLEAILHPAIQQDMESSARRIEEPYCIFSIPLLIEIKREVDFDRVMVVETPIDIRRNRIKKRSKLSDKEIDAILTTQSSDKERRRIADDLILNNGSKEELFEKIKKLNSFYKILVGKSSDKTMR